MSLQLENQLTYDYYKEEIKRCDICEKWIETKIYRLKIKEKMMFFHPFCFYSLIHKNPQYKFNKGCLNC
jgi:hypothetical protein